MGDEMWWTMDGWVDGWGDHVFLLSSPFFLSFLPAFPLHSFLLFDVPVVPAVLIFSLVPLFLFMLDNTPLSFSDASPIDPTATATAMTMYLETSFPVHLLFLFFRFFFFSLLLADIAFTEVPYLPTDDGMALLLSLSPDICFCFPVVCFCFSRFVLDTPYTHVRIHARMEASLSVVFFFFHLLKEVFTLSFLHFFVLSFRFLPSSSAFSTFFSSLDVRSKNEWT